MRRLAALALVVLAAPAALAQSTPAPAAPAVATDSLLARAARAEAAFFAGQTAALHALADSAFRAAITPEMHAQIVAQLQAVGGATAEGAWTATEVPVPGMKAFARPYLIAGQAARLVVAFDPAGRIAGMVLQPEAN